MFRNPMEKLCTLLWSACMLLAPYDASAQAANTPVRILVGFAPGGATDSLARLLAQKLTDQTGQTVIVENRPGAAGSIAAAELAKAPGDGRTFGMLISTHVVSPHVMKKLPFNALKDFVPIAMVAQIPSVLVAHPSFPAKNLSEAMTLIRQRPGYYTYALPGSLTAGHVTMELLKERATLFVTAIPYRGAGPALADLLGGQTNLMMNSPVSSGPYVKSGKLKIYATSGAKRLPDFPDVPTIAESGVKDFAVYEWFGMFGPAAMPKSLVTKWSQEIARALGSPEMKERLRSIGAEEGPRTPEEFAKFVNTEFHKWEPISKRLNIGLE